MQKRYYTVDEANQAVPFLEATFTRIIQMRRQIGELHKLLDLADSAPEKDTFDVELEGASTVILHNRGTLKALILAVQDELEKINATGCLIKSVDTGLVDWYAQKDGRDVFLCWHLGEDEVRYWHDIREGVRGRRPIEELHETQGTSETEAETT
jgi:hypothetical protein